MLNVSVLVLTEVAFADSLEEVAHLMELTELEVDFGKDGFSGCCECFTAITDNQGGVFLVDLFEGSEASFI
jgi:hypothetical protein